MLSYAMSTPTPTTPPPHDPIKTYDARWEIDEFSDSEIRRLFHAALTYGAEQGADLVTIANDGRTHAGHVAQIALDSALEAGFDVWYTPGPIGTPASYFTTLIATAEHPGTMGLTITASHNPGGYIGVKLVVPPVRAIGLDSGPAGGLTRIRQIYHHQGEPRRLAGARGRLSIVSCIERYIESAIQLSGADPQSLHGTHVVLDAMNGSAGPELYRGISAAGAHVVPIDIVPDGTFPRGAPNPTSRSKLNTAVQRALAEDALVVGLDGDGDRIVFGDGRGILQAGFAALPVLGACRRLGQASRHRQALFDPKVSPSALTDWRRLGFAPEIYRNGHSQIKDHMARINAVAAIEESGHYYHAIRFEGVEAYMEHSLLTTLLFLTECATHPETIDHAWHLQRRIRSSGEVNYQFVDDTTRDKAMESVLRFFRRDGATCQTTADDGESLGGTRVLKGICEHVDASSEATTWYNGFIRISTNEKAVLRVFVSSDSEPEEQRLESEIRAILGQAFSGRCVD